MFRHPIVEARQLTPDPLAFEGYLWKYQITISESNILEEYQTIIRVGEYPERVTLTRAYMVYYPFNGSGWNVASTLNIVYE